MMTPGAESGSPVALRVTLPCQVKEVRPAAMRIRNYLHEQGVPGMDIQSCELALVEACNNAVQYARDAARAQPISIDVLCFPDAIELAIRDHTAGFHWPSAAVLPEDGQERGRGLFLIQSLMDEAQYFQGDGTNCLVLRKRRSGPGNTPQAGEPVASALDQVNHQLRESEQVISDMAEELSFCYESLSAIFRCSAELGRNHSLKEFAQRLLTDLAQITSADWFVLRLLSRDGTRMSVFTASEPALRLGPLLLHGAGAGVSLEAKAALARQDTWFEGEEAFAPDDPLGAIKPGCIGLIHPFGLGEQLMGTIAVGKGAGGPRFTAVHANVVHTFADFLGIQIANARFQEEQVRARVFSRELEIARNIQRSLLPKTLPQVSGYALAGFCESAQQVGGDFYDVLRVNDSAFLLIIADVMGKGIPAAIFAAILRSLLRAVPEWTHRPAHLLSRVNRWLFDELSGVDMFITTQLVYVDTAAERLVAASAGHCPLLLASRESKKARVLSPEGMPLGVVREASFGAHEESLARHSRMLLYTDGLTEARNPSGEFFGQDRLAGWLEKTMQRPRSAQDLKEELAGEVRQFQGSSDIRDDQTFLIMA